MERRTVRKLILMLVASPAMQDQHWPSALAMAQDYLTFFPNDVSEVNLAVLSGRVIFKRGRGEAAEYLSGLAKQKNAIDNLKRETAFNVASSPNVFEAVDQAEKEFGADTETLILVIGTRGTRGLSKSDKAVRSRIQSDGARVYFELPNWSGDIGGTKPWWSSDALISAQEFAEATGGRMFQEDFGETNQVVHLLSRELVEKLARVFLIKVDVPRTAQDAKLRVDVVDGDGKKMRDVEFRHSSTLPRCED